MTSVSQRAASALGKQRGARRRSGGSPPSPAPLWLRVLAPSLPADRRWFDRAQPLAFSHARDRPKGGDLCARVLLPFSLIRLTGGGWGGKSSCFCCICNELHRLLKNILLDISPETSLGSTKPMGWSLALPTAENNQPNNSSKRRLPRNDDLQQLCVSRRAASFRGIITGAPWEI